MKPNRKISLNNLADILGVSRRTIDTWIANGRCQARKDDKGLYFLPADVAEFPEIKNMQHSRWHEETIVNPIREFTSIELFAGGGGLAIGAHLAGFKHVLLNEFDKDACDTLKKNMPGWNVIRGDIHDIDFTSYKGQVDFLSGGFPCQAFSYAGKRLGFEETRGTLFFELARAVKEVQPKVFMCENVKGLMEHDNGRTLDTIRNVIAELGYTLLEPRILRAILYNVPQKRERLILIAIRNDIADKVKFEWPSVCDDFRTLKDAFFKGHLYDSDVPDSEGQKYPETKRKVMELVPEGGGKTGMARRLSMDEASLTLTCAPAQKQTERCHPTETRPLTVREYARIQTFPDNWEFCGSLSAKYKQIGNAVPVNLAWAICRSLIRLFNQIEAVCPTKHALYNSEYHPVNKLNGLFANMVCEGEE